MSTGKPLKGKALVRAEEWRAVLRDIEQWDSEPDGRARVSAQIKRLMAAIRKDEATWALGSHRTSAAVAREVFMLCKFSDHAGIWPTGLLDALRLVLNIPATATMTTDGNHTDTQTPQMRAVAEYWRKNPDATNSEVARNVLNSRGKPLDATGIRNLLDPNKHPGFAAHVSEVREEATKRKITRRAQKEARPVRRRRATT